MEFPLLKHINKVRALQFFQVFRFGILFLISIIFTKTSLGTGEIGVYETFLLIAGSVSFFWIGGMLQSLLSVSGNSQTFGKSERNPVFFNVFVLFTLLSVLSAVLVLVSQSFIADLFSLGGNRIPYMKILFMYIAFSGPVNLIEYFYLLKNKPLNLIIYGIISFGLQLICITAPVVLGYDLGYGLYGLVLISGLRFLWLTGMVAKYSVIKFSKTFLKEFVFLSGPLVLSILLSGSAQYIDGFLVSYWFDEATLAVFRYGARELPIVTPLIFALGNAITPMFSEGENHSKALIELKKGSKRLMNRLFPFIVIILLFSKYLFPIVFNQNFVESAKIFNIYILLTLTNMIFTWPVLVGLKDTKPILISTGIEIFINVVLSVLLIKYLGITGVAIATVIAFTIERIILIAYIKRKHKIKFSEYMDIRSFMMWIVIFCLAFTLSLLL